MVALRRWRLRRSLRRWLRRLLRGERGHEQHSAKAQTNARLRLGIIFHSKLTESTCARGRSLSASSIA